MSQPRSWRNGRGHRRGSKVDLHPETDQVDCSATAGEAFETSEVLSSAKQPSESSSAAVHPSVKSVLVVGAGPTGVLCAAFLREEAKKRCEALSLSLWEDARGPSGRMSTFWADVAGQRAIVDVGAQVVSVRDPTQLPSFLRKHLCPAESLGLSNTTSERGRMEHGWHHFYIASGMTTLHKACLEEAELDELCFKRRVVKLSRNLSRGSSSQAQWHVSATGNYHTPEGRPGVDPRYFGDFDAVVFAGTAKDAGDVAGLAKTLPQGCPEALQRVRYDHRYVLPLVLKPALRPWLDKLFGDHAEICPSSECPAIDLVFWQDKKRVDSLDGATSVVLHSTTEFAAACWAKVWKNERVKPAEGMIDQFAELLRMPLGLLRTSLVESKLVHWMQCQLRTPFRQPKSATAGSAAKVSCLSGTADMPPLVLAGDYFLGPTGCFDDCLVSARSAATSVADLLTLGSKSISDPQTSLASTALASPSCPTVVATAATGSCPTISGNICSKGEISESGYPNPVPRRRWNKVAGG